MLTYFDELIIYKLTFCITYNQYSVVAMLWYKYCIIYAILHNAKYTYSLYYNVVIIIIHVVMKIMLQNKCNLDVSVVRQIDMYTIGTTYGSIV